MYTGRWTTVSSDRTDSSGSVSLVLPPVSATTAVRLKTTNGVHSSRWRVTLHPELSVTSAPPGADGTVVITVRALGAQAGDRVELATADGQVASGSLGPEGSVVFTVTPSKKQTTYVAQLPATAAHGADRASITVIVKHPAGGRVAPSA
jgi:hypothetical protein